MSDWQAGDLALCVDGRKHPNHVGLGPLPKAGALYRVTGISLHKFAQREALGLYLDGAPANNSGNPIWGACRFRRIPPLADITGFEEPRRIPVKEQTHV